MKIAIILQLYCINQKKRLKKAILAATLFRSNLCHFILVEVVGADRLLRSACRLRPAAPRTVALDRGLLEGSPDLLTTATPSRVLLPPLPQLKKAALMAALLVVEVVGVEPTSESISAGISPSAVNDLKFRFSGRPLTGCRSGYPVSPLKYREIPQRFPV